MLELNLILLELITITTFFICIFIYSAISTNSLSSLISFLLYLIFIFPFYLLILKLENLILINDLEKIVFLKVLVSYFTIFSIFIGLFLFVQLVYLFFYS